MSTAPRHWPDRTLFLSNGPAAKRDELRPSGLTTTTELITPEMAKAYLGQNNQNRRLRIGTVQKYAKDMVAGQWKLTHQGIGFYHDGGLADGQHRLNAIVLAGVAVWIRVTRGLDRNAGTTMDIGAVRNEVDLSKAMGCDLDLTPAMSACAKAMRLTMRTRGETVQESLCFAAAHIEAIKFAVSVGKTGAAKNAVVRSVIARAWYSADREELATFGDIVGVGRSTRGGRDDGALMLRNLILREPAMVTACSNRTKLALKTHAALKAFLEQRSMSRLYEAAGPVFVLPEERP